MLTNHTLTGGGVKGIKIFKYIKTYTQTPSSNQLTVEKYFTHCCKMTEAALIACNLLM